MRSMLVSAGRYFSRSGSAPKRSIIHEAMLWMERNGGGDVGRERDAGGGSAPRRKRLEDQGGVQAAERRSAHRLADIEAGEAQRGGRPPRLDGEEIFLVPPRPGGRP